MAEIVKEGHMYIPNEVEENTCKHCGTISKVAFEEAFMGEYGNYFYRCPYCGQITPLDKDIYVNTEDLTVDNIEYPTHFHYMSDIDIDTSDGTITRVVRGMILSLRENDEDLVSTIEGDTMIIVFRMEEDEEYHIFVGKNYEHSIVGFKADDYFAGNKNESAEE